MAVKAVLRDGSTVTLHRRYGETAADLTEHVGRGRALLGSGAPPAVELETADGGKVPYADVNRFEFEEPFLP